MFGFDRITFDPDILGGKACIRGMRIDVSLIVNLVATGMTTAEIIQEYPDLEAEDVRQALQYAAWTTQDIVYTPLGVPQWGSCWIWDWQAAQLATCGRTGMTQRTSGNKACSACRTIRSFTKHVPRIGSS